MKRTLHSSLRYTPFFALPILATLAVAFALSYGLFTNAAHPVVATAVTANQVVAQPGEHHSARILGEYKCIDCHEQQVRAWRNSAHGGASFDRLRTSKKAEEYGEELGLKPEELTTTKAVCVKCHATVQKTDHSEFLSGNEERVIHSITCEACHGGSGGDDGWLNAHGSYGYNGAQRHHETLEHSMQRKSVSEAAGQRRTENIYNLARSCFECHIEGDEALVEAGHDQSNKDFEFLSGVTGIVRHNFHLDDSTNAETSTLWLHPQFETNTTRTVEGRYRIMAVVGQLADLDVTLTNLAKATDYDGDYFGMLIGRFEDGYEVIEEFGEEIEDDDEDLSEAFLDLFDELEELFEEVDGEDLEVGTDEYKEALTEMAAKIREMGKAIGQRDGSNLPGLDEFTDVDPKGDVYQP